MSRRIIYSRGFPYGAPLVMLRGGGLNISGVKGYLREQGFRWNSRSHAWESYMYRPEFETLLKILRDAYGAEIHAKEGMDESYLIAI
jgi:hypothetical protein